MHRPREFFFQGRMDRALARDPGLALEGGCDNPHAEMAFPAWPSAGMALVQMRLINHGKLDRREGGGEFALYFGGDRHVFSQPVNCRCCQDCINAR